MKKKDAILFISQTPLSYWIGISFYSKKEWQKAINYFKRAIKSSPLHPQSNFKLGMCYFRLKNWSEANFYIKKAVELLPTKDEWKVQLYQTELQLYIVDGIKLRKSASSIEESMISYRLETEDGSTGLYSRMAELLHKQGKAWQEIEALEKAIEFNDKNPRLYFRLAEALEVMKRYKLATQAYEKGIQLKKKKVESSIYYRLGYCYEKQEYASLASDAYSQAIRKDSEFGSKSIGIGIFHEKRGLWFDAVNAYEEALSKSPDNSELNYRLGLAYQRCYNWKESERYYLSAIKLNGSNPNWFYQVGFVREKNGLYIRATEYYQKAIEKKYTSYWCYRLGLCYFVAQEYKQSTIAFLKSKRSFDEEEFEKKPLLVYISNKLEIDNLKNSLSQDYTNTLLWQQLGDVFSKKGEYDKAADAYCNLVLRHNHYDSDLYYQYGMALARLNLFEEASKVLKNIRQIQTLYGTPGVKKFDSDQGFRQSAVYSEYYKTLEVNEKTILLESFSGVSMSCNPLAIFLEMISSEKYQDFLYIWVINDITVISKKYKKYKNVIFVKKDSDLYMRYLCSAKYLINNSTFPPYFIRKEQQLYLNTWHGTPWKTLGKDIKNSFMELKNTQRNFLQSTHMISPNPHTSWVLIDRYDINDIYTGKVLESGYPRIDLTLNTTEARKAELRKELGIDNSKKVILYAPTWKGTLGSPEVEADKLISEIKLLNELDINLLFRGHYFVQKNAYKGGVEEVIVPEYINTNELLSIVDILITDYSSIGFDFMSTGNPIIYYLDDYQEYKASRGLYFESSNLPGDCASSIDTLNSTLMKVLDSPDEHRLYKKCQATFTPFENGKVSKTVINWFVEGQENKNAFSPYSKGKKSILMFGGGFSPNGITTSFINLVNNIDYDKYSVTLAIDPDAVSSDEKRLEQFERLPSNIKIIPRVGRMNRSIEDNWVESKTNQYKFTPESMKTTFIASYNTEFKRMFGIAHFDVLIEFTGYSRFWSYLIGSTQINNVTKAIYQHNDKNSEWRLKYPSLENTFNTYPMFDKLISVSKQTMNLNIENLQDSFNLDVSKFSYCDNAQDPLAIINKSKEIITLEDEKYFNSKDSIVFINMARLSPEKDQEKLIKSFSKLVMDYPKAKLLILGDGPLKHYLSSLVSKLGLSSNVFLLGIRFNPFPYLKRADCFVLSSNYEGQPMTLLEAMILEKPVISTDIIGSRSALENRPGYLVDNSEQGLYLGMKDFIEGKLHFERFDYETYQTQALEMFYTRVCN